MAQIIVEDHVTPRAARSRVLSLRSQGIHAWMYHDFTGVTSGTQGLERIRQTTTVAWTCVVDGLFDQDAEEDVQHE